MKKRLSLVIVLLILFSTVLIANANQSIPVSSLDYTSRYTFDMKDSRGEHYFLYIYSPNEKPLQGWPWSQQNDKVFQGDYYVGISKSNSKTAQMQDTILFGFLTKDHIDGIFNTSDQSYKNRAYVVRSNFQGQPDILIIAQQTTGGGDANARAFYINDGMLYLLYWQGKDSGIKKSLILDGQRAVKSLDSMNFETYDLIRSLEYRGYIRKVWELDLNRRTLVLKNVEKIGNL